MDRSAGLDGDALRVDAALGLALAVGDGEATASGAAVHESRRATAIDKWRTLTVSRRPGASPSARCRRADGLGKPAFLEARMNVVSGPRGGREHEGELQLQPPGTAG